MLSCRQVSELVSQSLERKLSLRQRFSLRIHLSMCTLCAGFRRQLLLLREAAHHEAQRLEEDTPLPGSPQLSREAGERMKRALESQDS